MTNREFQFTYYLHDRLTRPELIEYLREQIPEIEFMPDLITKIGEPFHEVRLDCLLDADTGQVTIREATA